MIRRKREMITRDNFESSEVVFTGYGRVSTTKEEQMVSHKFQLEDLEDFFASKTNWVDSGLRYDDNGKSGTNIFHRKDFQRMMLDAKAGRFNLIVMRDVSRFARYTKEFLIYLEELEKYGVVVYFVNYGLLSNDVQARMILPMLAAVAEEESRMKSDFTKAGHKKRKELGFVFGSNNRYGWDLIKTDKGKSNLLVINEEEAKVVRLIFDLYINGRVIKCVYGRRSSFDIPATLNKENIYSDTIDLVSFDDFDLNCLKKDGILKRESNLSKVFGDSHYVIATWDKNSYWKIGDKIQIGHEELEIAGLLKYDLFSGDGMTNGKLTLISSAQTFARLTGVKDYSLLMLKTTKGVTEQNLDAVRNVIGNAGIVKDIRDQHTIGTYTAFMFFVYGFLIIITLVTLLNIINSISMSVSARIKQYGAMRAVGMDEHQILKVIASEAFIYTFTGCIVGCAVGFPLNRKLYNILISDHFSYAIWELPIIPLFVILIFVFLAVIISVYFPVKRIKSMAITETINEL